LETLLNNTNQVYVTLVLKGESEILYFCTNSNFVIIQGLFVAY